LAIASVRGDGSIVALEALACSDDPQVRMAAAVGPARKPALGAERCSNGSQAIPILSSLATREA